MFTNYNGNKYVIPCCRTPVEGDEGEGVGAEDGNDWDNNNNSKDMFQRGALINTPITTTTSSSGSRNSSGSNGSSNRLFVWLEEYLRRLEVGVYQWQPLDLTRPEMMHISQVSHKQDHTVMYAHHCYAISRHRGRIRALLLTLTYPSHRLPLNLILDVYFYHVVFNVYDFNLSRVASFSDALYDFPVPRARQSYHIQQRL